MPYQMTDEQAWAYINMKMASICNTLDSWSACLRGTTAAAGQGPRVTAYRKSLDSGLGESDSIAKALESGGRLFGHMDWSPAPRTKAERPKSEKEKAAIHALMLSRQAKNPDLCFVKGDMIFMRKACPGPFHVV